MPDTFRLRFEIDGDVQLSRAFSRFGEDVHDLKDAFTQIADNFQRGEQQQFDTEGNYGAGGWKPLAESTRIFKEQHGFPDRILVRTGSLRSSLAGNTGETIGRIEPLSAEMGTTNPAAGYHQRGTRRMPARPVIKLPEEQKTQWTKIIHTALWKRWKGSRPE